MRVRARPADPAPQQTLNPSPFKSANGKDMHEVKVERPNPCACLQMANCPCAAHVNPEVASLGSNCQSPCQQQSDRCHCPEHVVPEIKEANENKCCRPDDKACLNPCAPVEHVAPELKETHIVPEVKEKSDEVCPCELVNDKCGCKHEESEHVVPEIKEPPCSCVAAQTNCACAALKSN